MSRNTVLTELWCNPNLLMSLDVSQNTALEQLACLGNQMNTLDLTNNAELLERIKWYEPQVEAGAIYVGEKNEEVFWSFLVSGVLIALSSNPHTGRFGGAEGFTEF